MIKINKKKFKIVVLSGGFETERQTSIQGGEHIYNALVKIGYKKVYHLIVNDKGIINDLNKIKPDFAFVAMLCKWGEDGVIQSLLEIMEIPYSGNGVEASALCKNKYYFSMFAKSCGVPVPETLVFDDQESAFKDIKKIKYPSIVKPVYQGNSIGVSLVKNNKEFKMAINYAFKFGSRVIVQKYIKGRELTVGVIDLPDQGPFVLPPIEFKIIGNVINDFEVKENVAQLTKREVPASLSRKELLKLKNLTLKLYKKMGCVGVSRFDLRMDNNGSYYFLENNTFPGIQSLKESYLTTEMRTANISFEEFVQYMIYSGLKRKPTKIDYDAGSS